MPGYRRAGQLWSLVLLWSSEFGIWSLLFGLLAYQKSEAPCARSIPGLPSAQLIASIRRPPINSYVQAETPHLNLRFCHGRIGRAAGRSPRPSLETGVARIQSRP